MSAGRTVGQKVTLDCVDGSPPPRGTHRECLIFETFSTSILLTTDCEGLLVLPVPGLAVDG